jgi:hypothetical protein
MASGELPGINKNDRLLQLHGKSRQPIAMNGILEHC